MSPGKETIIGSCSTTGGRYIELLVKKEDPDTHPGLLSHFRDVGGLSYTFCDRMKPSKHFVFRKGYHHAVLFHPAASCDGAVGMRQTKLTTKNQVMI